MQTLTLYQGDVLKGLSKLKDKSVHCCVTSPPYWNQRDYGHKDQLGCEKTPQEYVTRLVEVFREVKRILRDDGCFFLNLGDTYSNSSTGGNGKTGGRNKSTLASRMPPEGTTPTRRPRLALPSGNLIGIPWRVAFALQADGWTLRQDIIWHKKSPMPESVTNRCTKAHEYVFLLTKGMDYYFDAQAIREKAVSSYRSKDFLADSRKDKVDGTAKRTAATGASRANRTDEILDQFRNKRSVWTLASESLREEHFAAFPQKLVKPMILAGTSEKGCCPHCGTPWRRQVTKKRQAARHGKTSKVRKMHGKNMPIDVPGTRCSTLASIVRDVQRHVTTTTTLGWEPGCNCPQNKPVPCVICDPFSGSGTSGLVAYCSDRSFVGCELNPKYVTIACRRIEKKSAGHGDMFRQPILVNVIEV